MIYNYRGLHEEVVNCAGPILDITHTPRYIDVFQTHGHFHLLFISQVFSVSESGWLSSYVVDVPVLLLNILVLHCNNFTTDSVLVLSLDSCVSIAEHVEVMFS